MTLSVDQKRALFNSQNKEGFIFHGYSDIAKKNKFLIVVGETEDSLLIGHVFINSQINKKYAITPELQSLHMPLYAKDYDFLSHDSYIDCTRLHDIEYKKIETMFGWKQASNSQPFSGFNSQPRSGLSFQPLI